MALLAYTTPELIRGFTRFDDVKTRTDPELALIAKYTTLRINAYTGHTFEKYQGIQKVSGNDQQLLTLPGRLEVLEQVTITVSGYPVNYPASDYSYNDNQIYALNGRFDSGFLNIDIKGTWGWSDVPEDVLLITNMLAEEYCLQRYNIDMDTLLLSLAPFSQQTIGAFSYKLRDPADPAAASTGNPSADIVLKKYRFGDSDGLGQGSRFWIEVI